MRLGHALPCVLHTILYFKLSPASDFAHIASPRTHLYIKETCFLEKSPHLSTETEGFNVPRDAAILSLTFRTMTDARHLPDNSSEAVAAINRSVT